MSTQLPHQLAVQKAEKALGLCKPCSVVTKMSIYYQPCVQPRSKTQALDPVKKVNATPAKTSTQMHLPLLLVEQVKNTIYTYTHMYIHIYTLYTCIHYIDIVPNILFALNQSIVYLKYN